MECLFNTLFIENTQLLSQCVTVTANSPPLAENWMIPSLSAPHVFIT